MAIELKKTERFERWLTADPQDDCIYFRKTWRKGECIVECTILNAPYCGLELGECRFHKTKEQERDEERKRKERSADND